MGKDGCVITSLLYSACCVYFPAIEWAGAFLYGVPLPKWGVLPGSTRVKQPASASSSPITIIIPPSSSASRCHFFYSHAPSWVEWARLERSVVCFYHPPAAPSPNTGALYTSPPRVAFCATGCLGYYTSLRHSFIGLTEWLVPAFCCDVGHILLISVHYFRCCTSQWPAWRPASPNLQRLRIRTCGSSSLTAPRMPPSRNTLRSVVAWFSYGNPDGKPGLRFTKGKSAGFPKSRQVSKPRDQYLELLNGSEILQAAPQ